MRRLVVVVVVVAAFAGLVATSFLHGDWRFNHPDPLAFPVWGVDVSHHQGRIDWSAVSEEPRVRFAYVKATEGGDWVDPRFRENWSGARAAGLATGAYHFFTFCRSGAEQAAHFLATVPIAPDALPPALDVEFGGNCAHPPPADRVRGEIDAWLDLVEARVGRRPIVYLTDDARDAFFRAGRTETTWIRSVWTEPDAPFAIWQFDARGRVAGIDGPVDLDVAATTRWSRVP